MHNTEELTPLLEPNLLNVKILVLLFAVLMNINMFSFVYQGQNLPFFYWIIMEGKELRLYVQVELDICHLLGA